MNRHDQFLAISTIWRNRNRLFDNMLISPKSRWANYSGIVLVRTSILNTTWGLNKIRNSHFFYIRKKLWTHSCSFIEKRPVINQSPWENIFCRPGGRHLDNRAGHLKRGFQLG